MSLLVDVCRSCWTTAASVHARHATARIPRRMPRPMQTSSIVRTFAGSHSQRQLENGNTTATQSFGRPSVVLEANKPNGQLPPLQELLSQDYSPAKKPEIFASVTDREHELLQNSANTAAIAPESSSGGSDVKRTMNASQRRNAKRQAQIERLKAQVAELSRQVKKPKQRTGPKVPSNGTVKAPDESQAARSQNNASNMVEIDVDGEPSMLSPIVLRDMCTCSSCVDGSSRQKLFSTADIPVDIAAASVSSSDGGVTIRWHNDIPDFSEEHKTELSLEALSRIPPSRALPTRRPESEQRVTWTAALFGEQVRDVSYEAYMEDDATLYSVLKTLRTHGLVFIANVPDAEQSVATVAERIGPLRNTFYGSTWDVRSVPQAQNVAYTSQHLGFHMDLLYMEQPPHLQFLHCIRSSSVGGASLFTDSLRALEQLHAEDPFAFRVLAEGDIYFHYDHHPNYHYWRSRKVIEMDRAASARQTAKHGGPISLVENVSWSPPFQAPFHSKNPMRLERWHVAAQKFNAWIHRPEAVYERLMKPGECVIFDNRRILHARKAFELGDVGKERWLRGTYVDKDPYLSKLRVLGARFGDEEKMKARQRAVSEEMRDLEGMEAIEKAAMAF